MFNLALPIITDEYRTSTTTVLFGKGIRSIASFQLKRGEVVLGRLIDVQWDMFWSDAGFEPTDAFLSYQSLFDEEYQALEAGDIDTVNRLQEEISEFGLRLVEEADKPNEITDFMLHIYGSEARFRA